MLHNFHIKIFLHEVMFDNSQRFTQMLQTNVRNSQIKAIWLQL